MKYANTITPSTIRYQPNTLKSWFLIYPIKNLIARMDTPKATAIPKSKINTSVAVNTKPNFTIFKRLAPNITGIAKKKVYSAASFLLMPSNTPPIMVAPEREVPGINANTWKTPMNRASLKVISRSLLLLTLLFLF